MRTKNPNLKILVAIGGSNRELVDDWSNLAANSTSRNNFAGNAFNFLQRLKLNGINIDWKFPNFKGEIKHQEDKHLLNVLLRALQSKFASQYSLSITMLSNEWSSKHSSDVRTLFSCADFVNVLTYRLHGETGLISALYRGKADNTPRNKCRRFN